MYQQVAKLFQNQEDLLQEFSQFLPDANGGQISFAQGLSNIREGSNYIPPAKKQAGMKGGVCIQIPLCVISIPHKRLIIQKIFATLDTCYRWESNKNL